MHRHPPPPALALALVLAAALAACADRPGAAADAGRDAGSDLGLDAVPDAANAVDAGDVVDAPRGMCEPGVDSDFDTIDDDVECREGTNPRAADTDGDGLRDDVERAYPRACVAADRARQRRPPIACTAAGQCLPGESCVGLSASSPDSDGDGVSDRQEDPGGAGRIDPTRGETDPRLWDTDGDGRSDGDSGLAICRPEGLIDPRRLTIPRGTFLVGLDPAWPMAPRDVLGATEANGAAALLDDPAQSLAALVHERDGAGGDVRAEAVAVEQEVVAALGAVPVLVGQGLTTHEMLPAVRSLYRVVGMGGAGALRDRLAARLVGAAAPAGTPAYGAAAEHLVEVVTVLRAAPPRRVTLVAVLPRAAAEDPRLPAAIRADDLVNTTGLAERSRTVDFQCQRFTASGDSLVDFLWLVDTSGSMAAHQERLGNTATRFFARLTAAGVDFRVGVFEAGSVSLDLDAPGFAFINGADPGGARLLSWQVTYEPYLGDRRDVFAPYHYQGGQEEPVAAGVYASEALRARTAMGVLDPDRRLREGATAVAFFVTDEPGTNDDGVLTRNAARWGATYAARLRAVGDYYRSNNILTFGLVADAHTACSANNVDDLPKCVILNNGGAFIPITTATDVEVSTAMNRIVENVAGTSSQFQLDRTPLSATLQVRVEGRAVPRSRLEGFDYDAAARAVVFYGPIYRPRRGDEVVVSYRVWAGSLG